MEYINREIDKFPHHSIQRDEFNRGNLFEYSWIAYPIKGQSVEHRLTATAYQVTLDPHLNKAPIRAGEIA